MWWITVAIVFAFLGLFPTIVDKVAALFGISYPPVLALTVGLTILVIKILVVDIERSRNAIKLQRLVQRIALLESDLREIERKSRGADPDSGHNP
jgi:hypothetical protein